MIFDVNGTRFSLASMEVDVQGYKIRGGSGLKLSQKLEPGEVEGNDSVSVGWTKGKWSGSGGMSLPYAEFADMVDSIGDEYGTKRISMVWSLVELEGDGVASIEIPAARISGDDFDAGDRQKHSAVQVEFTLLEPAKHNGRSIVLRKGSSGADFSISFSV